jgi:hypothetical protein
LVNARSTRSTPAESINSTNSSPASNVSADGAGRKNIQSDTVAGIEAMISVTRTERLLIVISLTDNNP